MVLRMPVLTRRPVVTLCLLSTIGSAARAAEAPPKGEIVALRADMVSSDPSTGAAAHCDWALVAPSAGRTIIVAAATQLDSASRIAEALAQNRPARNRSG